jgi:transposase
MSRPPRIDPKLVSKAQALVAKTSDLGEFRAAQAILLPAIAHTTLEETASLLGVGRATVARLQQRLRQSTQAAPPTRRKWGGRRRALLSFQQEVEFLAPWIEQAKAAGVLVVSPLRAALAEKLGRKVAPSILYRLLARHGWRKVSPDTKHPKSDPAAQAEWKKNSPRCWQICSPPKRSAGGPSA